MSAAVVIAGHLGNLAQATAEALRQRGCAVRLLEPGASGGQLSDQHPCRLLCFPFPGSMTRRRAAGIARDLADFSSLLAWAARAGVVRVVLRSHAAACGPSMKNPGLMGEERISLLAKNSHQRRWLRAESLLWQAAGAPPGLSAAAVRLTNILDPEEGDLVTRLLGGRIGLPLAGYDPMVQLLTVEDAAAALAAAVLSSAPGLFNVAGPGAIPLRSALRAAVPVRIPAGVTLQKAARALLWKAGCTAFPPDSVELIRYNWTVSTARAQRELSFHAGCSSAEALRQFLKQRGRGRPDRVAEACDDYGLDPDYLHKWERWFLFLRKLYWRVESEGIENVPATGGALLVSNHRGFMPFDGVVHRSLILEARRRHIRFLVIPSLFKFPFLSNFLIKQGGVVASQATTATLLQRNELVGIFPEGIHGAFRMYRGAYRLGEMGKNVFARIAIANSVAVIPAATIGHVEIFPILGRIRSSMVTRATGWPFLPITPTFPLLPFPLPTKWHIRYLEPIAATGLQPADANNPKRVREFSEHVRAVLQRNIDEMLARRKHIFFGNIFGRAASVPKTSVPAEE
ncbi:MAG: 1-acyl-sn-glycerol-3-phosphate acyltransferase [Acidobacteria bacterium]|nr:1-acyl-sn-glycerol-3-phosphate acyltransferase [Acidobacteriota bacterium]